MLSVEGVDPSGQSSVVLEKVSRLTGLESDVKMFTSVKDGNSS